jgi:hypothetical protein
LECNPVMVILPHSVLNMRLNVILNKRTAVTDLKINALGSCLPLLKPNRPHWRPSWATAIVFSMSDYIPTNYIIINEQRIGKDMEENSRDLIQDGSRTLNFRDWINPRLSRPILEPGTFRIRNRSANHSTAVFGSSNDSNVIHIRVYSAKYSIWILSAPLSCHEFWPRSESHDHPVAIL